MMKSRLNHFVIILALIAFLLFCAKNESSEYFGGCLAAIHPIATEIGSDILAGGGNAFDCAVAVGFALAVVYPQVGNLIKNAGLLSFRAAAVLGTVAGLPALHQRFGTMPLEDLMGPAIQLAENGFALDSVPASDLKQHQDDLTQFESTTDIFFKFGKPLGIGDALVQKNLAQSLKRIRDHGLDG